MTNTFNMKYYYKRKLPHFIVKDYAYFITTRLANSLPTSVINRLKKEYAVRLNKVFHNNKKEKIEEYENLKWDYFETFDDKLDFSTNSPHWLRNKQISEIVKDSLHFRDGKDWELIAYTIMSNHIHLVILPNFDKFEKESRYVEKYPLGKIMGSFKKFTGAKANRILNRAGPFWQAENYDHIIRNKQELVNIVKYVLNNPVKVGLVLNPEDYNLNYYNPKYLMI